MRPPHPPPPPPLPPGWLPCSFHPDVPFKKSGYGWRDKASNRDVWTHLKILKQNISGLKKLTCSGGSSKLHKIIFLLITIKQIELRSCSTPVCWNVIALLEFSLFLKKIGKSLAMFLVAKSNSIRGFVRPWVGLSVGRSIGWSRVSQISRKWRLLDNKTSGNS